MPGLLVGVDPMMVKSILPAAVHHGVGGGGSQLILGHPGAGRGDHGVERLIHQLPGPADTLDLLGALDVD